MKIGIDIDGVLTDVETYQLDLGSKYFYLKDKTSIKNNKAYYTTDVFDISKEDDGKFWSNTLLDYGTKEPARKFASEVIKKLKEDGNEIYIITARGNDLSYIDITKKQMQNIVLKWLKENFIYYDKIIFSKEGKLDICLENNIDVMIEDKPKNINKISTKIPVICYHANYNDTCKGNNIIRCYSWYDIYSKIKSDF